MLSKLNKPPVAIKPPPLPLKWARINKPPGGVNWGFTVVCPVDVKGDKGSGGREKARGIGKKSYKSDSAIPAKLSFDFVS